MSSRYVRTNPLETQSRLIKAMKGWSETDKPYYNEPEGMFGRVAKIKSNGATLKSEELDFEFEVPFDDDLEANEATITVYNLSKTTIQAFKIGNTLTIEAGYKNDTGVIFEGVISKVSTKREGVDKVTTIYASDYVAGWDVEIKNKTYKANTKASTILKDLLASIKLPIAVFAPRLDHTYTEEVTIDGMVWENIKKYAEVCGVSVYANKGQLYARYMYDGDNNWFIVSSDTGLIDSPETFEEEISTDNYKDVIGGFKFKMLLHHRLATAAVIKLQSENVKALCRVRSGKHIFNPDECVTEIEAISPDYNKQDYESESDSVNASSTTSEVEPEPEVTTSRKIPLLYVGSGYSAFTQEDCDKLVAQSYSTEYLLTTAYSFNYYQEGVPIITQDIIDNIPDSYFGSTEIESIKKDMTASLEKSTTDFSDSAKWNYSVYVDNAVALSLKMIKSDSSCKLWFGIPPMLPSCTAAAKTYNSYYEDVVNAVKEKMQSAGKWDNVEGFYYGQEDIPQWYTKFDTEATNFNNVVVENMVYISDIVHGLGKKMLWIPYYRDDGTELVTRVGHIINKTNIFDLAILQPSYYFDASLTSATLTMINNCVEWQKCVSLRGDVVGSSKTSSTEIGAEMEIDIQATTDNEHLNRYKSYVFTFSSFITGDNKRPMAFYADKREVLMDTKIFDKIKAFFGQGK